MELTEEQYAERVEEVIALTKQPAWEYFLDFIEEAQEQNADIADLRTVEDLYYAKGFSEALDRVIAMQTMLEQSRDSE